MKSAPTRYRCPRRPPSRRPRSGSASIYIALADRAHALAGRGDFLLVEGAGGLLVPYADGETTADLAARLGLPLLIVGRMALGTINHVALTIAEAKRRRLPIAGCVLSRTEPEVGPHEDGNVALIAAVSGHRPLAILPHLPADARDDDDRVADAVRDALGELGLRALGLSATP